MANISKTLTPSEIADLADCENIIELTKTNFIECGNALMKIQMLKLYRRDYDTWEVYCQKRWGFSRQRALQLVTATVAITSLPTNLSNAFDISERAGNELAKVPEKQRPAVVKQAEKNGVVTAPAIKEAAARLAQPDVPRETVPVDEMGFPIPAHVMPNWNLLRETLQTAMTAVSQAKSTVAKLIEDRGSLKVLADTKEQLGMLYYALAQQKPIVVCLECGGGSLLKDQHCKLCNKTGVQGKLRLDAFPALIETRIRKYHLKPFKTRADATPLQ